MSNDLESLLSGKGGSKAPAKAKAPEASELTLPVPDGLAEALGVHVAMIEVECIVGGVLQRVNLTGVEPQQVAAVLRGFDPNATWRDDFPRKGNFGARETKLARALVISVRATDNGLFWDFVCQNGEDLSIGVSKKKAPEVLGLLEGLGKVSDKHLDKLRSAISTKGTATVILPDEQQFGVSYWLTDDGKAFLDGVAAAAPEAKGESND